MERLVTVWDGGRVALVSSLESMRANNADSPEIVDGLDDVACGFPVRVASGQSIVELRPLVVPYRHEVPLAWALDRAPTGWINSCAVWALPESVRVPNLTCGGDNRCACQWCSPDRDSRPMVTGKGWDILVVGLGNSRVVEAWCAHGPEFHGFRPKRSVVVQAAGVAR